MNKTSITLIAIGVTIIIGAAFFVNMKEIQKTPSSDMQSVSVTFYPFYFFAHELARDYWQVRSVVPHNIEPHDYEPTARDIEAVLTSDIFIHSGLGFEGWAEELGERVHEAGGTVIEASDEHDARAFDEDEHEEEVDDDRDDHGDVDPHIWLSPIHAQEVVARIAHALRTADADNAAVYTVREQALTKRLDVLKESYETGLAQCTYRTFVTSHGAFGYLADDFKLHQESIAGLSPDAEPSPRALANIAKLVQEEDITHIFMEELGSPKLVETIARETGVSILELSPIEGVASGEDYFSKMEQNLENLRIALQCT